MVIYELKLVGVGVLIGWVIILFGISIYNFIINNKL